MFRWCLIQDVQKVAPQVMPSLREREPQFAAMTVLCVWKEHSLGKKINYSVINQMAEQNHRFPFSYRMTPNQEPPYSAIIQLLLQFQWTWIGLLSQDNEKGEKFKRRLEVLALKNGICIVLSGSVPEANMKTSAGETHMQEKWKMFLSLIKSQIKIIVCQLDFQALGMLVTIMQMIDTSIVGRIIQIVAWVLSAASSSQRSKKRMQVGDHQPPQIVQPWQLHRFLRNFQHHNISRDGISFDENGVPVGDFDIMQWTSVLNKSDVGVKIGTMVPYSRCTESCSPGYAKLEPHKGSSRPRGSRILKVKASSFGQDASVLESESRTP
ncbi:uncharacterized protein LOC117656219 [Pantherophis guttatus]|uniref:Uncharacterized protein LOC117656219 n=1 Tax=Pantherophis guttatus TaxID=94885 RepID=A0ABM3ZGX0_PANGU|nr:uncharacterized protein LOC117656219 [Pantherophis guttatus]